MPMAGPALASVQTISITLLRGRRPGFKRGASCGASFAGKPSGETRVIIYSSHVTHHPLRSCSVVYIPKIKRSLTIEPMGNASSKSRKDKIHRWIGRCITEWAGIEETIFDVCCIALATKTPLAAIVFYRSPTIETRLVLTNDLLKFWFPKAPGGHEHQLLQQWDSLQKKIRELTPYRNLMAHHPIDVIRRSDFDELSEEELGNLMFGPTKDLYEIATKKKAKLLRANQFVEW